MRYDSHESGFVLRGTLRTFGGQEVQLIFSVTFLLLLLLVWGFPEDYELGISEFLSVPYIMCLQLNKIKVLVIYFLNFTDN